MNTCIICEYGWIIKGFKESTDGETVTLKNASVLRQWENNIGIGGIVKAENKDCFTLDYIGDVIIRTNKILFEIPCEW